MIQTELITDKAFLSLNYNTETGLLTGDNQFKVTLVDTGDETPIDLEVYLTSDESIELSPSVFTATLGEAQSIAVRLADDVVLEDGQFTFKVSINNEYAVEKSLNTSILSSNKNTTNTDEYKLKYFIERLKYRCNIYELVPFAQVVTPIEINGRCDLSYQEKKDLTEPIVSATLKMRLEASLQLDLQDLYSENEKTFKVEMIKEGQIVFSGYILPDGIWADFVRDKWVLDITATCGLSSLKNIAFAQENSTGDNLVNFFGRMTAMQIISNCLQKTGLYLPIYVNCQIGYVGWAGYSILSTIYLSVERYFQSAEEPMDCDSALRSIMQIFGCTIVQFNNAWYVYRAKDMVNTNPLTQDTQLLLFSRYYGSTYDQNITHFFGDKLGSQINDSVNFHCNENQKISISPSVQAFQISYQFGDSRNVLANGGLVLEGTGLNIPGWSINTAPDGLVDRGVRVGYSYGVRSAVRPLDPLPLLLSLNQSITLNGGGSIKLRIKYRNDGLNSLYLNFALGVQGSTTQYFNINTGSWQPSLQINRVDNYYQVVSGGQTQNYGNLDAVYELEVLIPIDGNVIINIYRNGHGPGGIFGVHSVELSAGGSNIKSKDYKARTNKSVSSSIKNSISVYNGDSESDLFVGTIFQGDSDTPTKLWNRYYLDNNLGIHYYNDNKELLEIISAETLSMSPRPMYEFEGDFKGYIDYVNFFTIDSFTKAYGNNFTNRQFQFLKWSYSFDDDKTKMFAREIEESNLDSNMYSVKIYENFGNENKITLVS